MQHLEVISQLEEVPELNSSVRLQLDDGAEQMKTTPSLSGVGVAAGDDTFSRLDVESDSKTDELDKIDTGLLASTGALVHPQPKLSCEEPIPVQRLQTEDNSQFRKEKELIDGDIPPVPPMKNRIEAEAYLDDDSRPLIAEYDNGSSNSVIAQRVVIERRMKVAKASGVIRLATQGITVPRIGTCQTRIRVGRYTHNSTLEIQPKLVPDLLIGNDQAHWLGWSSIGPGTGHKLISQPDELHALFEHEEKERGPSRTSGPTQSYDLECTDPKAYENELRRLINKPVSPDKAAPFYEEIKPFIEANAGLDPLQPCNHPLSNIKIETTCDDPIFVPQYPIALHCKLECKRSSTSF